MSYVNTTAEVKAETDYCCTSGNAVEVINAIPADREILFLPDMFLGAHVRRVTGRANIHVWMGECHVHAGIDPENIRLQRSLHPDAEFFIHPECGCATSVVEAVSAGDVDPRGVHILSTEGMMKRPGESDAATFIVATEVGILYRLSRAYPGKQFFAANERASCAYMKVTTLPKVHPGAGGQRRRPRRMTPDHVPPRRITPLIAPAFADGEPDFPFSDVHVVRLVQAALDEDQASNDVTTIATVLPSRKARATLVAREGGVLCGVPLALAAFQLCDDKVEIRVDAEDGHRVEQGSTVLFLNGKARGLLAAERTALNFLQRLSGIATGADAVLLDNMSLATMRDAVAIAAGRLLTEASGGVRLDTVRAIADTGVDRISVGALTHSAPALNLALDFE